MTNPYAFADNDPVNLSDPSGLDPRNGPPKKCENCAGHETVVIDGGTWSPPGEPAGAPTTYTDMGGNYGSPGSSNSGGSSGSAKSNSGRGRSGGKGVCSSGTVTCSIEKYIGRPSDPEKLKRALDQELEVHILNAEKLLKKLMEGGNEDEELRDQYNYEVGQVLAARADLERLEKSKSLRTYMPELNRDRPEIPEFGALDAERAEAAAEVMKVRKYFEEKARRIPDKVPPKPYDNYIWQIDIHSTTPWFAPSIMDPEWPPRGKGSKR